MNPLARLLRRLLCRQPAFHPMLGPDGRVIGLMDATTQEYVQSTASQPTQASLDAMLDRTTRIRVIDGGMEGDKPMGRTVLAEVADPEGLATLRDCLRIIEDPNTFGH